MKTIGKCLHVTAKITFFVFLLISFEKALLASTVSVSGNLACGEYEINAWANAKDGHVFLVVAPGAQSEMEFVVDNKNSFEALEYHGQAVSANVKLVNSETKLIQGIGKKWLRPRVSDFRSENKFSELLKKKKTEKCKKSY